MPKINPEFFLSDSYVLSEFKARHPMGRRQNPRDGDATSRKHLWPQTVQKGDIEPQFSYLDELRKKIPPHERKLLNSFIRGNGPLAVWKSTYISTPADEMEAFFTQDEGIPTHATGIVFERLVHLWMAESPPQDLYPMDPGSCKRLFKALDDERFIPDGIMLSLKHAPQIEHIFEYKMNPFTDQDRAQQKFKKMREFAKAHKGKTLKLKNTVILDLANGLQTSSIGVSPSIQLFLVIPSDRKGFPPPPDFNVIQTPFGSHFASAIAKASLRDVQMHNTRISNE